MISPRTLVAVVLTLAPLAPLLTSAGCGANEQMPGVAEAKLPKGATGVGHESCDESGNRVEMLDSNNDGKPDIRRVFDKVDRARDLPRVGPQSRWAAGPLRVLRYERRGPQARTVLRRQRSRERHRALRGGAVSRSASTTPAVSTGSTPGTTSSPDCPWTPRRDVPSTLRGASATRRARARSTSGGPGKETRSPSSVDTTGHGKPDPASTMVVDQTAGTRSATRARPRRSRRTRRCGDAGGVRAFRVPSWPRRPRFAADAGAPRRRRRKTVKRLLLFAPGVRRLRRRPRRRRRSARPAARTTSAAGPRTTARSATASRTGRVTRARGERDRRPRVGSAEHPPRLQGDR